MEGDGTGGRGERGGGGGEGLWTCCVVEYGDDSLPHTMAVLRMLPPDVANEVKQVPLLLRHLHPDTRCVSPLLQDVLPGLGGDVTRLDMQAVVDFSKGMCIYLGEQFSKYCLTVRQHPVH